MTINIQAYFNDYTYIFIMTLIFGLLNSFLVTLSVKISPYDSWPTVMTIRRMEIPWKDVKRLHVTTESIYYGKKTDITNIHL